MNGLYAMEPIYLENGIIKPITKFEDFSEIIDIFKEPPFGEPLTMEDKLAEYNGYLCDGLALGFYSYNGEILGYIGIMDEVEEEHESYFPNFVDLKPVYIYGLATKSLNRKQGIGSILIDLVNKLAIEQNVDFVYARVNNEESMSEGIAKKLGFEDLYQNGELVYQDVSTNQAKVSEFTENSANLRRFIVLPLTRKGNDYLLGNEMVLQKSKCLVRAYNNY